MLDISQQPKRITLSKVQNEIFMNQMIQKDSPLYTIGGYIEINTELSPKTFERSLQHIVAHSDALCTQLDLADPLHPIASSVIPSPFPFWFIDLSGESSAEEKALSIMHEAFQKSFNLHKSPLFEFGLIALSQERFIWLKKYHHLVTDGWSTALTANQLVDTYNAFSQDQTPEIPSHPYSDFVQEEATFTQSDRYEKNLNYWLEQFEQLPEPALRPLSVTAKKPSPPSGETKAMINGDAYSQLIAYSEAQGVTLFSLWLSILYVYFTRRSGHEDFCVGLPNLNRSHKRFRQTLGLFANLTPNRFRFSHDMTFHALAQNIQAQLKRDFRHQRVFLSDLYHHLGLAQKGLSELHQVSLSYEKQDYSGTINGVEVVARALKNKHQHIPLTIFVREYHRGEDVVLDIEYNKQYFNEHSALQLQNALLDLVTHIEDYHDLKLKDIPLLTDLEKADLRRWNDTAHAFPTGESIARQFEAQVERTPQNLVAYCEGKTLRYDELNTQANRLAHYLISKGVQANRLVGICVTRSLDMLVAVLGILKAGGAYVPMDPDYPQGRLTHMVEDSGIDILLTQSSVLEKVASFDVEHVLLNRFAEEPTDLPEENPPARSGAKDLAYMIYTSGSTGVPKGVLIEQAGVVSMIHAFNHIYQMGASDRVLQQASFSFDVSVGEMFPSLCSGGTLYIASREVVMDPQRFKQYLIEHDISCFGSTPSLIAHLDLSPQEVPHLRYIFSGGEALTYAHIEHLLNCAQVINGYGPTEATVGATAYRIDEQTAKLPRIPIGKPVANYEVYIFDKNLNLLPVGTPGELCIAGVPLARGYHNDPALTQEKFVEVDILGERKRVYKTGDLACWTHDGMIDFLGRIDNQVKVRGFRIELGEIEHALGQIKGIESPLVIARKDPQGSNRLVAYCLNPDPFEDNWARVKDLLLKSLPNYMVPSFFVTLDTYSLTPNGKVDTKQLPEPDYQQQATTYEAPRNALERKLSEIWQEVLGVERVGIQDNFFDLGGHSLLATQVVSRMRQHLQLDISLSDFLARPTLLKQAELFDTQLERPAHNEPIEPLAPDDIKPMSFAQERMLFLSQLENQSKTYEMQASIELTGSLDIHALEHAFTELVARHETLRTTFPQNVEHSGIKLIPAYCPIRFVDLSAEPQAKDRAAALLHKEEAQPIDITNGPLLKILLVSLSKTSHVMFLKTHHIISDGWSIDILFRELSHLYNAFKDGETPSLKPLDIGYSDFAHWQRKRIQEGTINHQLDYWKQHLDGAPELMELPTDYPRPAEMNYKGSHFRSEMTPQISAQVNAFCKSQNITSNMFFLAAFKLLLAHYSRQKDIVVGSPIANRNHYQSEHIFGLFVNTLILRSELDFEDSFEGFLSKVKTTTLEAYDHQDIPFEYLVEALNPQRSLSYSPLFQVLFVMQNAVNERLNLKGLSVTPIEAEQTISKFDLTLSVTELDGRYLCDWEYSTNLFKPSTLERMSAHLQRLISQVLQSPKKTLGALALITDAQSKQIQTWNETAKDFPKDKTVAQLFEDQVDQTPHNTAVIFEGATLTYAQLNKAANRIAYSLIEYGISADTLVGICVDRSLEMVIGVLAVLKAGGAYLPIAPDLPHSRKAFFVEDSSISLLLTQSALMEELSSLGVELLSLDSFKDAQANHPNPPARSSSRNLAYMIYTSGSTGKPKGVMIEQVSLVNMITAFNDYYQIGSQDRVMQQAAFSFDVCVGEMFPVMCAGGALVIPTRETLLNPSLFKAFISKHEITVFAATPTFLAHLSIKEGECPHLRYIFSGGEAVKRNDISNLPKSTRIFNGYGPTEATIGATRYEITKDHTGNIPIGKPLTNYEIYILNEQRQLVPPGIPGELCIGGLALARGYWNRPELTQEKFSEVELFGTKKRLYFTGDLARWLDDGNIEFLGRIDHQVKLRGFRIELGEIESALIAHDAIKEALVLLDQSEADAMLVAYLTLLPEKTVSSASLKNWLKQQLPAYMLPTSLMVLEQFPLTPNGKIDRNALPKPSINKDEELCEPKNETEFLLCNAWSAVLGYEVRNTLANFFNSGGHSLMATRLVSRIRMSFGIEMPLTLVFEKPVLKEQAKWLAAQQRGEAIPDIAPRDRSKRAPLSYAQQRLWFLARMEGDAATYNIPSALKLGGEINIEALRGSLALLIERHESLRAYFPSQEGIAHVAFLETYDPLKVIDLSHLEGQAQEQQIQAIASEHHLIHFDLEKGPLMSLALIHVSKDQSVLLFNMHHIICDGWSIGILLQDWAHFYNAILRNEDTHLPPLEIQYTDYALWQRQWLQGHTLERQLGYWKTQLNGLPGCIELPLDYTRPAEMSSRGSYIQPYLDKALTDEIKQFCLANGVTPFMTLLAAYALLLARYSRQTDIAIGSPIANRNHHQSEDIIGFFVNTLVLRTQIQGVHSFKDLIEQVKKTTLEAQSNQDVPFEMLVDAIKPERTLSHTPLFQVMFTYQEPEQDAFKLDGVRAEALEDTTRQIRAKCDLTLGIAEDKGQLRCDWGYCSDLFKEATIEGMHRHFSLIVSQVVNNPEMPLDAVSLLSETDQACLHLWNETTSPYPKDKSIAQIFEAQAERTPEHIAAYHENRTLTYEALNQQANQLAHFLIEQGVQPNRFVGVCVNRSLDMLIAIMATLKAGGAYVPIDPDYPDERILHMVEDSGIQQFITQKSIQANLPKLDVTWTFLEEIAQETQHFPKTNPTTRSSPQDLAYMIYTSGSTGKPKGVLIEQEGVVNLITDFNLFYDIRPSDRLLQQASLSFDVSVFEIFSSLCAGITLYIAGREITMDPVRLRNYLIEHKITFFGMTPALLAQLDLQPQDLPHLRYIVSGGEAINKSNLNELQACAQVFNGYGPTEATVFATTFSVESPVSQQSKIPIGKPLTNYQLYILDEAHCVLPVGVPGELCVSGIALARGYHNKPDLTASKFIDVDVLGETKRLYKTGDLARWLWDGNIEFLGRMDQQVKLRGFRIELGEIEQALAQHEKVEKSVVILDETPNSSRLLAYVTLTDGFNDTAELMNELRKSLPEYMIPAAIIALESMPLTPNKKIDRKALPKPLVSSKKEALILPKNQTEIDLLNVWKQVLMREAISTDDSFFEIGGDSILSIQMLSKARASGMDFALKDLFKNQSIASLAQVVRPYQSQNIDQGFAQGEARLGPIQRAFLENENPNHAHFNQSLLLKPIEALNPQYVEQALQKVVNHHDTLRLKFQRTEEGNWKQWYDPSGQTVAFCHLDLREGIEDTTAALEAQCNQWQRSFDLTNGPLGLLAIIELPGEQRLFWSLHHLLVDGVSWRILLEDLQTAYQFIRHQKDTDLPLKTSSFQAWTNMLSQWSESPEIEKYRHYWKTHTAQNTPLKTDFPKETNVYQDVENITVKLDKETTRKLLECVDNKAISSINTLLIGTLTYALQDQYEGETLLLDFESHGRTSPYKNLDVSRTAGWFTSVYPVCITNTKTASLQECIQKSDTALADANDMGLAYGVLKHIKGEPLPEAQILFNYLGQMDQTLSSGLFEPALESTGEMLPSEAERQHVLDFNSRILQGELIINVSYSKKHYRPKTLQTLVNHYVSSLKSYLNQERSHKPHPSKSVVEFHTTGTQKPFFLIPGAGSIALYLRGLASALGKEQPVYALESPNHPIEDIPHSIEDLAQHYVQQITAIDPEGPYSLVGHSFGALVTYEMTRLLEASDKTVELLAILDQPSRKYIPTDERLYALTDVDWLSNVIFVIQDIINQPFILSADEIAKSDYRGVLHLTQKWLKDHNALELLFSRDSETSLEGFVEVYKRNGLAVDVYPSDTDPVQAPIHLFLTESTLELQKQNPKIPETWGWGKLTSATCTVYPAEGKHISMIKMPYIQKIADTLKRIRE